MELTLEELRVLLKSAAVTTAEAGINIGESLRSILSFVGKDSD